MGTTGRFSFSLMHNTNSYCSKPLYDRRHPKPSTEISRFNQDDVQITRPPLRSAGLKYTPPKPWKLFGIYDNEIAYQASIITNRHKVWRVMLMNTYIAKYSFWTGCRYTAKLVLDYWLKQMLAASCKMPGTFTLVTYDCIIGRNGTE